LLGHGIEVVEVGPGDLPRGRAQCFEASVESAPQKDRQQLSCCARVAKCGVCRFVLDAGCFAAGCQCLRACWEHHAGKVSRAKRRAGKTRHHQARSRELAAQVVDVERDHMTDDDPTGEASADRARNVFEARGSRQHRSRDPMNEVRAKRPIAWNRQQRGELVDSTT
jgi:hypothetical protein